MLPSFPKVRFFGYPFFHWFLRIRVEGESLLPAEGPFLLFSNHASYLDPLVLGFASRRREISFLAKEELFRIPLFGSLIRSVNAFPVRRGTVDQAGLSVFYARLAEGRPVLVFPEGTRSRDGELQPAKKGAGLLALRAGVPVYPAFVDGTFRLWPRYRKLPRPGPCSVRFGPPVPLDDLRGRPEGKEVYREAADRILSAVAALKKGEAPLY